jgi:hypothetical protein
VIALFVPASIFSSRLSSFRSATADAPDAGAGAVAGAVAGANAEAGVAFVVVAEFEDVTGVIGVRGVTGVTGEITADCFSDVGVGVGDLPLTAAAAVDGGDFEATVELVGVACFLGSAFLSLFGAVAAAEDFVGVPFVTLVPVVRGDAALFGRDPDPLLGGVAGLPFGAITSLFCPAKRESDAFIDVTRRQKKTSL